MVCAQRDYRMLLPGTTASGFAMKRFKLFLADSPAAS
jgi:hypothetical protein